MATKKQKSDRVLEAARQVVSSSARAGADTNPLTNQESRRAFNEAIQDLAAAVEELGG